VKSPSATYTSLPAGQYTLLVKGANNDGIWSTDGAKLLITVLPPWWKTWYAWMAYFLLFFAATYYVTRFFWVRNVFEKEKELQQVKLNFFTNISHEIRTRLMLISGPVEQLLKSKSVEGEDQRLLGFVSNSSDSLLNLVNELMDFRKMESGTARFVIGEYDIVAFIKNVLAAFEHLSQSKDIKTSFSSNSASVMLWYDPDQLQKVMYNLLMNAYKFTEEGGNVRVLVKETDGNVQIEISDDGIGIAPQHLNKLFENYFQVDESTGQSTGYGVGLALSKGIVENLKGSLEVTSRQATGSVNGHTVFKMALLKGKQHFMLEQIADRDYNHELSRFFPSSSEDFVDERAHTERRYTVVLVEDNDDLRAFVSEALGWQYRVIQASNGQEGWALAVEHIPDLVVSDVMMAEMDGLELCRRIKSNISTSHIPVILLTAKTTMANQLEGLGSGADLYVTKPLSMQILELSIRNILHARGTMQLKYSRQIVLADKAVDVANLEEEFLNSIVRFVEDHIDDKSIGVPELCRHIGMSKSVLYKKLRALVDMTINDFMKMVRLKIAARLLEDGGLSVHEVAFRVGYDDRKYFSAEFKKQFGKTPSEYALKNSKQN
jgi:signal transduction histidine kinase/AraC-like DNA-binding protein